MPEGWRLSEEDKQAMVEQYEAGDSLTTIAERYGCVINNVRHILKRRGVQMRQRGGVVRTFSAQDKATMVSLWAEGKSQTWIAGHFGTSQVAVSRILRSEGAPSYDPSRHSRWKGGRVSDTAGYIRVIVNRDDPLSAMADTQGYVAEHRLVMARQLGRPLTKSESVHHIDGDRQNNAIENLQLRQGNHGTGVVARCLSCGSLDIEMQELK